MRSRNPLFINLSDHAHIPFCLSIYKAIINPTNPSAPAAAPESIEGAVCIGIAPALEELDVGVGPLSALEASLIMEEAPLMPAVMTEVTIEPAESVNVVNLLEASETRDVTTEPAESVKVL